MEEFFRARKIAIKETKVFCRFLCMKNLFKQSFLLGLFFLGSCTTWRPVTQQPERDPASFQSCLVTMNNLINYKMHSGPARKSEFAKAESLSHLEELYGHESLIEIQRRLSDADIKENNKHLKTLFSKPMVFSNPDYKGKIEKLSDEQVKTVYDAMANSNVHKNHYCYDTKGTIGFCFGRATIAHMEAIARNVHPDSVRKIWIAGDMGVWGHHVATMVYTQRGWMVLDTNIGMAVTTDAWIARYMPMKKPGSSEIMVFTTQAGRFGPYDTQSYNAINLFNTQTEDFDKARDFYRGYFHDYFDDLDKAIRPKFPEDTPAKKAI